MPMFPEGIAVALGEHPVRTMRRIENDRRKDECNGESFPAKSPAARAIHHTCDNRIVRNPVREVLL
jgi:hypothetical protein